MTCRRLACPLQLDVSRHVVCIVYDAWICDKASLSQTSLSCTSCTHAAAVAPVQVSAALERILGDVKAPAAAALAWRAEQQEQQSAFNTANAAAQPAVYYSPALYQDLTMLYHTLQEAVAASTPAPVDAKKGQWPCAC